ncbi:hypothetical protein PBY51_023383 [Eleginops maclovinus]|uniref:Uncharacterized protein n=1 Tax=Eleginops maclovinus TaxID=56733 RepID=A0AAN7X0B4_ELEMC|nr:hypothetical protein PBY51_023383 [Eleginops maclovinus]
MGEDMDKERHAMSDACCRERTLSSSHFRVSEQQRNDCLFSPSAPAGACSGLPRGHGDTAPLFHAVYYLYCCETRPTLLQCHRSTPPLYLCQRPLTTYIPQYWKHKSGPYAQIFLLEA